MKLDSCIAFSHNATDGTCTRTSGPCAVALPAPGMGKYMYAVVTEKTVAQCVEWVTYIKFTEAIDRLVTLDQPKYANIYVYAARLVKNNVIVVGFQVQEDCFAIYDSTVEIQMSHGWACEWLRIADDCTAFWVPYRAGDTLPTRVVTGDTMANDDVMYIAKFESDETFIVGHYTVDAQEARSNLIGSIVASTTMELLVIL